MLAAGPATGSLRRDYGQLRAEVVQMQEGHGPSDRPEPEGDGGTSPGASWVPWDEPSPQPSDQPNPAQPNPTQPIHTQPGQPSYGQPAPGQPGQPGYGQPGGQAYPSPPDGWQSEGHGAPAGPPTTELGTWTMSA